MGSVAAVLSANVKTGGRECFVMLQSAQGVIQPEAHVQNLMCVHVRKDTKERGV